MAGIDSRTTVIRLVRLIATVRGHDPPGPGPITARYFQLFRAIIPSRSFRVTSTYKFVDKGTQHATHDRRQPE